ncbi:MAG: hypothetical protein R3268_11160, partial [Acidiferrobacterales bacterium]|nr:hypothetical protein [Acidiferrobacterales bacterium]
MESREHTHEHDYENGQEALSNDITHDLDAELAARLAAELADEIQSDAAAEHAQAPEMPLEHAGDLTFESIGPESFDEETLLHVYRTMLTSRR